MSFQENVYYFIDVIVISYHSMCSCYHHTSCTANFEVIFEVIFELSTIIQQPMALNFFNILFYFIISSWTLFFRTRFDFRTPYQARIA